MDALLNAITGLRRMNPRIPMKIQSFLPSTAASSATTRTAQSYHNLSAPERRERRTLSIGPERRRHVEQEEEQRDPEEQGPGTPGDGGAPGLHRGEVAGGREPRPAGRLREGVERLEIRPDAIEFRRVGTTRDRRDPAADPDGGLGGVQLERALVGILPP